MHKSVRYRKEKQRKSSRIERIRPHGNGKSLIIYPHRTDSSTWERKFVPHLPASNGFVHMGMKLLSPSSRIKRIRPLGTWFSSSIFPYHTDL
ncbi:hypothetical protein P4489_02670 [Heyndrickxia sporothermodurans]|uniref:hypothetical protein n=1 Tax=Heyndrickxia sporothermodurans TaxID=46224 RepID=UPI002E22865B|nr:hypothetical protein [Heyndrickxia sporothermodurans]